MTIKKMFIIIYFVTGLAIAGLGVSTFLLMQTQKDLVKSQEIRYKSYQVAIELRQNSEDLTRLARTYVVTGDDKYEKSYWDLVDISNGKKPRKDGRTISFAQMMKDLDFSQAEFDKIKESEDKSNELVSTEERAMNAVKGLFQDANGKYTVQGAPDLELARRLVHDENYHHQREIILQPIDEFFKLLDNRTQGIVDRYAAKSNSYLYLMVLLVITLIINQIISYIIVNKKVNKPIGNLSAATGKVAGGDFSVHVDYTSKDEIGHLSDGFNVMIGKIKDEIAIAQSFQQGLTAAMFIADKDTNILSINKASLSMMKFNKKPEDVIGKLNVKDVFLQDSVTRNAFAGNFMSGEKRTLVDHTGVKFPALIQSGPIFNSKNEMVACFANFVDLRELETKQKEYLNEQIAPVAGVINQVANGDLTASLELDEKSDLFQLGKNVNKMIGDLNNTLAMVTEAVQATASAANEISSSSEQMAAGSQEQSQQTTEVAGAVEQMTRTILDSTKNANEAAEMAKNSREMAELGATKVQNTQKGMDKIVSSAQTTARIISSLSGKTDQIGEIAQVIDDIADQTNLLALNAAIEAARAGEQGRGFAVVADEVRKLAERTTKATKEIADTIKAIQREAKEADQSMNMARSSVEEGMKLTGEVADVLQDILLGAKKTTDVVMQVAAASEEQSAAAEEISKNVEGISSVTQESAAGTEQIARAAEDLNRLTVNLQELISKFRLSSQDSNMHAQRHLAVRQNGKLISK
ncbi:MAG: methyl-accepting chemotaxis protein [Ignavibacteriales bacterium]